MKLKNLDILLGERLSYYLKAVPSYSGCILPINGQMSDMYLRTLSMQNSTTLTDRQRREKVREYQRTADRIGAEMQDIAASEKEENWKNINFNISLLALIHGGYRLDEENGSLYQQYEYEGIERLFMED
jgi:hypothetical protein